MRVAGDGSWSLAPVIFENVELAIRGMCSICKAVLYWQNCIVMAK